MARRLICAAAALSLLSTPGAAAGRATGDVYYGCHLKQAFSLPGFGGGTAIWAQPGKPNVPVKPGDTFERIDASVEVDEKDGARSNLSISWVQSGRMGWPYVWRADLHPIYLIASFQRPEMLPAGGPAFDPAGLIIKLDVVSDKKLSRVLDFRLWREGQDRESLTLGGPADVARRRKSAEVSIAWPELAAYAKAERWLHYQLYRSVPEPDYVRRDVVSEGRVDLSIMPALVETFRRAEQALMANVAARRDCTREIVPEPDPNDGADI
jgi:hypothetical protein